MLSSVPATVTFTPSESDTDPLDFAVQMKIDIVDGRLSCVSLTAKRLADGPPITSEALRRVPVADYVMGAARFGREILLERIPQSDGTYRLAEFEPPPPNFAQAG